MDGVSLEDAVMGEEIFGPILPVLSYQTLEEAEQWIRSRGKPLALYLFTRKKDAERRFLRHVPLWRRLYQRHHRASGHLGHGLRRRRTERDGRLSRKKSFETFSHEKSIIKKYTWLDLPLRYQPYKKLYIDVVRLFYEVKKASRVPIADRDPALSMV